jgi:protein-disulfide isomerase
MTAEILKPVHAKEISSVTRFAFPLMMAALVLPTGAKAEMTAEQKTEVEALVKQYILEHGELLIESVNKFQQKQEAEASKASEGKAKELLAALKDDKQVAVVGNPKGDVTVVEFFDYNCGYCKKAFEEVQSLVKDDKNVKIVLYDMPILGPESVIAAKWSLAAKKQDKYWEFHKALMAHQGGKDDDTLKKLATDAGLDAEKLAKDKDAPEIETEIQKHLKVAKELGIQGTPGFLIEEKVFRGYIPYDAMKATIKEIRDGRATAKQ